MERDNDFNWRSFYARTTPAAALPRTTPAAALPRTTPAAALPRKSASIEGHGSCDEEYFCLADLWVSFEDPSLFGVEVPTMDHSWSPSHATFIPCLSGFRIMGNLESGGNFVGSSGDTSKYVVAEYYETKPPHVRPPLFCQMQSLTDGYLDPDQIDLMFTHTSQLHEKSWLAIYWRPVPCVASKCKWDMSESPYDDSPPAFLVFYSLNRLVPENTCDEASAQRLMRLPPFGVIPHGGNLSSWAAATLLPSTPCKLPHHVGAEDSDKGCDPFCFFLRQNCQLELWLAREDIRLPDFEYMAPRLYQQRVF